MKLLHIDSSITGETSVSRKLSAAIVAKLRETTPGLEIVRRDLAAHPLPFFSAETLAGISVKPEPQPADKQNEVRAEKLVLGEFVAADIVVIGAPMYNFTVPAQLKTWIDYVSVAGVTFQYTPQGPVGILNGKRVFIASSRGGLYGPGSPAAAAEHQVSYLQAVMRFYGITDIRVIQAEGVRMGPDHERDAMNKAFDEIDGLSSLAV